MFLVIPCTCGPVATRVSSLEKSVSFLTKLTRNLVQKEYLTNLKKEVVINELLLDLLGHPGQWIVDTLVISAHFLQE